MHSGKHFHIIVICNLLFFLYTPTLFGQDLSERDSIKYASLKSKVDRAKEKVAGIELKLQIADSLVLAGDSMIFVANKELFELTPKRKLLEKAYKKDAKKLKKKLKSKDEEVAKQAEDDLKELGDKYDDEIKAHEDRLKQLTKQIEKAEMVATKGVQWQMTNQPKLEVAMDKLHYAEENLAAFEEGFKN